MFTASHVELKVLERFVCLDTTVLEEADPKTLIS